jgi:flagellar capping protein FliD
MLQGDGTTKFDSLKFANASADDLQSKLASGAKVGFQSTTNNLKVSISNALKQQGSIELQTISTKTEINTLKNKQSQLVDRLAVVENNYTMRYSKLNTLLFNLNNTSNSLTSSLTALTNMNASK